MVDRGSFTSKNLSFVDDRVRAHAPFSESSNMLPADFEPCSWTVLCGRGLDCYHHVGNKRFRVLCQANADRYDAAGRRRAAKSVIVMSIIDAVRDAARATNPLAVGGFVKQDPDTNRWFEIGDDAAREKVSQQLRNFSRKGITETAPTRTTAATTQKRSREEGASAESDVQSTTVKKRKRDVDQNGPESPTDSSAFNMIWTTASATVFPHDVHSCKADPTIHDLLTKSKSSDACDTASVDTNQSPTCVATLDDDDSSVFSWHGWDEDLKGEIWNQSQADLSAWIESL